MNVKRLHCAICSFLMIAVIACGCSARNTDGRSDGFPFPAKPGTSPEITDISTGLKTPAPSPSDAAPEGVTGGKTDSPPEPSITAVPGDTDQASPTPDPENSEGTEPSPTPSPESAKGTEPSQSPGPDNANGAETSPPPRQPGGVKPLRGKIICLDPGHQSVAKQGSVPIAPGETKMMPDYAIGTRGVSSGVFEYTVVMAVAKKLKPVLEELGAEVVMTKDEIETVISNVERAGIANNINADIFVRIHCDGSNNSEARGISVLYPGDRYLSDRDMLDKSLSLSKAILEGAVNATGAKNRGLVKRDDLIGFNYCNVPCTLIEMGFMTNPEEDLLLNDDSYQDKLVNGITAGICDYFELPEQ